MKKFLITLLLLASFSSTAEVTILLNEPLKAPYIDREKLYSIFTLRVSKWDSGTPITLVFLPTTSTQTTEFVLDKLRAPSLGRFLNLVNTIAKESDVIVFLNNDVEVIKYISNTKGAIGYVNAEIIINSDTIKRINIK